MKRRRIKKNVAGATIIESMIAMVVLVAGTAAIAELVRNISRANARAEFQAKSLEVYQQVASQVRWATCDIYPNMALPTSSTTDDGLISVAPGSWITAPVGGSVIRHIGTFDDAGAVEVTNPKYAVQYNVTQDFPAGQLAAFDVLVRIQQVTAEATSDDDLNILNGMYVRTYPVKKVCNYRSSASTRGGYP